MDGWTGKILRVDLRSGHCATEDLAGQDLRLFLGGRALGVRLFTREVDPTVDSFSAANQLIICAGALTATGAPSAAMATAVSKSPLTGGITHADIPGDFGAELKFAGYDALIVTGRAASPSYLSIIDGRAALLPADHLWGESTDRCDALIREEFEDPWKAREFHVLSIGPAGERMANVASLATRGMLTQGGSGLGAVMGSKGLKAIAVRGSRAVSVADGKRFFGIVAAVVAALRQGGPDTLAHRLGESGTSFLLAAAQTLGAVPVNNFSGAALANQALGHAALAHQLSGHRGCFACPVACVRATSIKSNGLRQTGEGPGYDSLVMLGTNCGVDNLAAITAAGYTCQNMGLDPISTGGTIALAMEFAREGLVGREEMAGDLDFGNGEAVLRLCRLIGRGQDMGCVLGNGAYHLAAYCERPERFVGVKGREMPPVEVRAVPGMALHAATSNCGAYHLSGPLAEELTGGMEAAHRAEGKAQLVREAQDWRAVASSLGVCQIAFAALDRNQLLPLLEAATGQEFSLEEMLLAGERSINLERAFNTAAGLTGAEDALPVRLREPLAEGPAAGMACRLDETLPEYYRLRGWAEDGSPAAEKLAALGLAG
ncbi:MAG: aldehyde ferredoxin oxidoreductase family protein [Pseudomonadota bacterium]